MADAITIKPLQDASLDAKSLEEVVNGDDAKQVTTRLGENYPSVKKAIKALFENGGLPATPFATKALMIASALVDGDYAMVTDDTVNNGLYIKTAGAWVKSNYDPVTQAKEYVDALKGLIEDSDVFNLVTSTQAGTDLVEAHDTNYNTLYSVRFDGEFLLPSSKQPLSETVGRMPNLVPVERYPAQGLQIASLNLMGYLPHSGTPFAPCPLNLQPQRYSVDALNLNTLKIQLETKQDLVINTHYTNDDKVVHPSIIGN